MFNSVLNLAFNLVFENKSCWFLICRTLQQSNLVGQLPADVLSYPLLQVL